MVSFDIDGTLTLGHGWTLIADRFGRRAAYDRTTALFARRAIGEDEHLANLLSIAEGHSVEEVETILEATPRMQHIAETVRELASRGLRAALLTHNPPYVCEWYVRRFGFEMYEGCASPPPVNGVIPSPGRIHADKLASLERLVARASVAKDVWIHAGDGRSDLAVFGRVGAGIAVNSHLREVREGADAVVDSEDLSDILRVIGRLRPRPKG